MPAKDQHLFLAATPYHILLSCVLAEENAASCEPHLLVLPTFSEAEAFLSALKQSSLFRSIVTLPYSKPPSKLTALRAAIAHMRESIGHYPRLRGISVCNDRNPFMQAALHRARQLVPGIPVTYIEDGAAAYVVHRFRPDYLGLSSLAEKCIYGHWYQHIRAIGTSRWIDDMCATLPDYVRPELQTLRIHPIDRDIFLRLTTAEWTDRYLHTQGVTPATLEQFDALFIAPHTRVTRDDGDRYFTFVDAFFTEASRRGMRIAIKYHPREPMGDYLQSAKYPGCSVIPQGIPAEFIFTRCADHLSFIIGDISTALMTARWLLPSSTVLSLADYISYHDDFLLDLFRKLGISFPKTADEVFTVPSITEQPVLV